MKTSSFIHNAPRFGFKVLWCGGLFSALVVAPIFSVRAAPKRTPIKSVSFDLTARFSYRGEGQAMPEQVMSAKVYASGNRARVESELAGRPLVVLYAPPYAYRLLPSSKTGVRYRANALPDLTQKMFGSREIMPNPQSIRAALQKAGARRSGTANLNGTPVDVWSVANFRGQGNRATAWLRRADSLPVRFEIKGPKLSGTASWKNYRVGRILAPALFSVPKDYRITEQARS